MHDSESEASDADRVIAVSMEALRSLLGRWSGRGRGAFPTIDSFAYEEELVFVANDVEPLIHYEQRTWDVTDRSDHGAPLHWESGFIRPTETGLIENCNAQNGGRVEVLSGRLNAGRRSADEPFLTLDSKLLGNDERMVRTRREFFLDEDTLRYIVQMATRNTPELTFHLEACVRRSA